MLAALEVERYRKTVLDLTMTNRGTDIAQATAATLDTLMTHDRESGGAGAKVLDNAWRGAAAYHYFLLAHRQLYAGKFESAMKTAVRLAEFEDVLRARDVYALIALAAYHAKYFGVCSRAFIKLETLAPAQAAPAAEGPAGGDAAGGAVADARAAEDFADTVQSLALQIFTQNKPEDPTELPNCYIACLETGTPYQACTLTGRAVQKNQSAYTCRVCRYVALEHELRGVRNCPLCHSLYALL